MKRIRPWFLASLCFLLCGAVFVMWVHSYRQCDLLVGQRGPRDRLEVVSEFGLVVIELENRQSGWVPAGWSYFPKPLPRRWHRGPNLLGFEVYQAASRHFLLSFPTPYRGIAVPWWFVFAATLTPLALLLKARRRRALAIARMRCDQCAYCGYDLRFSPNRCPECGNQDRSAPLLTHPVPFVSAGQI